MSYKLRISKLIPGISCRKHFEVGFIFRGDKHHYFEQNTEGEAKKERFTNATLDGGIGYPVSLA